MFRLYLMPVNPKVKNKWLMMAGATAGGTGTISLISLSEQVKKVFPAEVLAQYEHFLYVALAIAFISALPLIAFPNILTLTIVQLSFSASIQYFAYSLLGVFVQGTVHLIRILMIIMAVAFFLIFLNGLKIFIEEKSYSDIALGSALLLTFTTIWVIPIINLWR